MYQLSRLFLFALLATTIACGAQKSQTNAADSESSEDINTQIFRMMGDEATLSALDSTGSPIDVTISATEHIAIIGDTKTTDDGQVWVSAVIDSNDDSGSEVFYVKPQDVLNLPVAIMTIDNDADWSDAESTELPEVFNITIAGYEKAIPAMRVARMTYCYRYVKLYLQKIGLVKDYLPGASAYMAANILPKYGFKKVSRKPSQAIVNDVCVYKGGPAGHGHIEIKTSKGWYYGYGYKKNPIQNRIFIACFHK